MGIFGLRSKKQKMNQKSKSSKKRQAGAKPARNAMQPQKEQRAKHTSRPTPQQGKGGLGKQTTTSAQTKPRSAQKTAPKQPPKARQATKPKATRRDMPKQSQRHNQKGDTKPGNEATNTQGPQTAAKTAQRPHKPQ